MKMRRTLFTPMVLSFLTAVAGQALWWGDAVAQTTVKAASLSNTALVPISGIVTGTPESVYFRGQAKVGSRLAPDPDFNKPRLVLTIDLAAVSGVGSSTEAQYVISGPEIIQRRLAASHVVEITFPFSTSSGTATEGTGVASFALNFDLTTGAVTSATASVGSPNFPR
jgi:hypothetical protein